MKQFLMIGLTLIFGILNTSQAQSIPSPSLEKYFESFSVGRMPFGMAKKMDWTRNSQGTQRALPYKAYFENAVSEFLKRGVGGMTTGKFLVIEIGCGTQCVAIGLYNLETGVPTLLEQVATIGASCHPSSRLLVLDSQEAILKVYSNEVPEWLQTQYLVISDSGEAVSYIP